MNPPRVLIAGIGNIFLGDDAFGVEVAQRLARQPLPAGVRAVDFGIRGIDLAYALLDGPELAVLVDALPRGGGAPGTLYVLEPEWKDLPDAPLQPHGLDPVSVLRLVRSLGGTCPPVRVVGCEPASIDAEDGALSSLTPPVAAAVDEAIAVILALVREHLDSASNKVLQENAP